jgi:hypothetical protein
MGSPPVFRTGANFDSADFGVQGKRGQKRLISLSFWHELIFAVCQGGHILLGSPTLIIGQPNTDELFAHLTVRGRDQ